MEEYGTLKQLRERAGERGEIEVLVGGEWWVLRGTPRGVLWMSRPGRSAIHAVAAGRAERYRIAAGAENDAFDDPPDVIALGPADEHPDVETTTDDPPALL